MGSANIFRLAAAFAAAATSAFAAGEVALVDGGRARARIVLAADAPASEKFAAAELSRFVKELTGAEIPVGCEEPPAGTVAVRFARSAPDVKFDGFALDVRAGEVTLAANDPAGIVFGVYWLLNRFGKIYWFDPESGTDLVPSKTFALPAGRRAITPLARRECSLAGSANREQQAQVVEFNVRNGFRPKEKNLAPGDAERFGLGDKYMVGGHYLGEMVMADEVDSSALADEVARVCATGETNRLNRVRKQDVERLARFNLLVKEHPNRFPLVNGERCPTGVGSIRLFKGRVGNPCISDPESRQYILSAFRAAREKNAPGRPWEVRLMCDDNSQWCECERCAKLLKSKGSSSKDDRASDLWWDFVNWIAPRLLEDPKCTVLVGIYLTYRQFPEKVKPVVVDPDRMAVVVCPHGRCYLHSLTNSACKANPRYREMLEKWNGVGMPVNVFEYHCQMPGKGNYAFWERSWVEDLKWYRSKNICHSSGGLCGPWFGWSHLRDFYRHGAKARWQIINLTGHFSWDTDDDFETVRTELLTRYYRAAAKPMLEYHALLEDAIFRAGICMCYGSSGLPFAVASSEPGLLERARSLLAEADRLVGGDAELRRRIDRDKKYFFLDWESAAQAAGAVKSRPLPLAKEGIAVDGSIDEAAWKAAAKLDDFRWMKRYNVDEAAPDKADPPAVAYVTRDAANVYVAVECGKSAAGVLDVPPDGSTFDAMRGSHLQMCVMAPSMGGEYYHVALSHNGKTYSARTTNPSLRDLNDKLDFKWGVKDEAGRWTAEFAFPIEAFFGPKHEGPRVPKEGELWKLCIWRTALGADGHKVDQTSTGYPLHWMDQWTAFSFGTPGNLLKNPSFELEAPLPDGERNGRNWTFESTSAPTNWHFHFNGGVANLASGGAADGMRFLRVKPVNKYGGPEFVVGALSLYPPATDKLRIAFSARGEGEIKLYDFVGQKKRPPLPVKLDSPSEWKRYEVELPLNGTHPTSLVFRFFSKTPVDLDGVEVLR